MKTKMFEQLVRRIDANSKLLRTWELQGGISAQVTALEILLSNGLTKKLVVRQHGKADLKENPHIAADEYKLLQLLQSAGLPTPTPYYVDESCENFSTPYVVIEYMEGQTIFSSSHVSDLTLQLATALVRIHQVDYSCHDVSFLPKHTDRLAQFIGEQSASSIDSFDIGRILEMMQSIWPLLQRNREGLLHGDFWPGNVLWKDGRLSAIIDWEDAALGDPLADLANGRLEIAWAFGIDAMHDFTRQYTSIMTTLDFTNLPYWDLCAALRPVFNMSNWGLDACTEKEMREKLHWFVNQSLEKIDGRHD